MAGGDGSQALVASVAMAADVPSSACPPVPATTSPSTSALDRDDVLGALAAFETRRAADRPRRGERAGLRQQRLARRLRHDRPVAGVPRRQAPDDRAMLPDFRSRAPARSISTSSVPTARAGRRPLIQVSNNPYVLDVAAGFGSRARLDTGLFGVAAARCPGRRDVAAFVAAERTARLDQLPRVDGVDHRPAHVESGAPVDAGSTARRCCSTRRWSSGACPGAVRVRIPITSPATPRPR